MMKSRMFWLRAFTAGMVCLLALSFPPPVLQSGASAAEAPAAVVFVRRMQDTGPAELYAPYGVAVDELGNVYVADTNHHRIVKFGPDGQFVRRFGSEGSAPGQLYYPHGVSIGDLPNGSTGVYVADAGNNRIAVFTTGGSFVRQFGTFGGGDGEVNSPAGIAVLPGVRGAGVYVADTRNNRVARFSLTGRWLQAFTCADCPNGNLQAPAGIGLRKLENGDWRIYVVDQYGHQVHILSSAGQYLRSLGTEGSGDGQLGLPDDVAVDPDGSAYVVDPTFGNERVTKFSAAGGFLFSFGSSGVANFIQPHGVALDQRGNIYVADTGASDVYRFSLKPPKVVANIHQDSAYWIDNREAAFAVRYNGVERTCSVAGRAELRVRADDGLHVFTLAGRVEPVGASAQILKMRMSRQQATWLDQARPGRTEVALTLISRCGDDLRLTSEQELRV